MSPLKSILICVALILGISTGYYFLSSSEVYRRIAQTALNNFGTAVATKDRAKISNQLKVLLTDSAHIRLEVTYAKLFQQNNPAIVQEFDRESFTTFIDNILYSMDDYAFSAEITRFDLSADKTTALLSFHANAWADGSSSYEGTHVNLHYITDTTCTGYAVFHEKQAQLSDAVCVLQLASLPKSGQEQKLQNPAVIKELLR